MFLIIIEKNNYFPSKLYVDRHLTNDDAKCKLYTSYAKLTENHETSFEKV